MFNIENIYQKLLEMDAITYTKGEVDMAKLLYNLFMELPYFKENPQNLKLVSTDEKSILRFNQVSILEKGESKDAVLIVNTIDEPALSEKLSRLDIMSMKATTAALFKMMEDLSEKLKEGKVVLINVCDRYGEHEGIKKASKFVKELKDEGYNFKALFQTSLYLSNGEESVFFGSQAILRPTIFFAGKMARTTAFYDGIDPGYILSTIVRDITLNSELMDIYQNEVSEPIYVNRLLVPGGTEFQSAAFGYVSFTTTSVSHSIVGFMKEFKRVLTESLKKSIDEINTKYAKYCLKRDIKFTPMKNMPKIYTWDEYLNEVATVRGEVVNASLKNKFKTMENREDDVNPSEIRLRMVRYLYDNFRTANEPVLILYLEEFPFHRVDITGTSDAQRDLMLAVTSAINAVDPTIKRRFFFPEVSYSSFFDFTEEYRDLKAATELVPGDKKEHVDMLDISKELGIPSVTMGAMTKLINGEYVFDEDYHFKKLPKLMLESILRLLDGEKSL